MLCASLHSHLVSAPAEINHWNCCISHNILKTGLKTVHFRTVIAQSNSLGKVVPIQLGISSPSVMAASTFHFPTNHTHFLTKKLTTATPPPTFFNPTTTNNCNTLRAVIGGSTSSSVPYRNPINVDYLQREFGGHGVSFKEIGGNNNDYFMKMTLGNGSVATLMLPYGLIISYKPLLWHGGTQEVLHSRVVQQNAAGSSNGTTVVQGGVSLALSCEEAGINNNGFSWSPTHWSLRDVRGNTIDSIEVEIVASDSDNGVEVNYIVTLLEDTLTSQFSVLNSSSSSLQLKGSVLTHLKVSTPDATYAVGLEGSNFSDMPPLSSRFSLIPPQTAQKNKMSPSPFQNLSFKGLFPGNSDESKSTRRYQQDAENEEMSNYKHLTAEMSRVYTSAPRNFTIIDRGTRNSVIIGRKAFEELYMYSPGSTHEWYGEYAYVCTGQSALLKAIPLGPQDVWRGEQSLHNPNL